MKYREIMSAELAPNCYAGKGCDEIKHRWKIATDGQGSENLGGDIILDPSTFPPGTRIEISIPQCPTCQEDCETCSCGFDWKLWTLNNYS